MDKHKSSGALTRSKNFTDLREQTEGEHQLKLPTNGSKTTISDEQPEIDDDQFSRSQPSSNSESKPQQPFTNERYVNVDTQTSIFEAQFVASYDNVDIIRANSSEEVNQQQQDNQQQELSNCFEPENDDEQNSIKNDYYNNNNNNNNTHDDELDKVAILRKLLAIERQRSEQKKANNDSMKQYLNRLQEDYLTLQRDLLESLEMCHKIKAQKDAQIEIISETLNEKDRHIDKLKHNLENLDETKVREEFKVLLDKQSKLAKLEKDQLAEQIHVIEQQLVTERVNNSQILQQFQNKLDQQLQTHEQEVSKLTGKISSLEMELNQLLNEDKNQIIKNLREEKSQFKCQVDELNLLLKESKTKHENLQTRVESLAREHEQIERSNRNNFDALQEECTNQKKIFNELKLELEDKEEVMQILQINLQRSEKRVKKLLTVLEEKEALYKELINQLELKHSQELEKLHNQVKSFERTIIENECQIDKRQNEIIKLELEHENHLESLKNDRDQRINKLLIEKQKVDKDFQSVELKLARQVEEFETKSKLIEQLQKEVIQFKEESKRLTIELTKSEAKLFSRQKEFDQFYRNQRTINQNNLNEQQQVDFELDQAKQHSRRLEEEIVELKEENEKLRMKLKLHETNISKINSAIKKEHAKMIHDYEAKLDEIKFEQGIYDKNKIKYKKYGHKLKKYCDHLRLVHNHLCNSSNCGYIISPMKPQTTNSTPTKRTPNRSSPGIGCQNIEQQQQQYLANECFSSDCESSEIDKSKSERSNSNSNLNSKGKGRENNHNLIRRSTPICRRSNDKFLIKRTGNIASPCLSQKRKPLQKSALSFCDNNNAQLESSFDDPNEHKYYYISDFDSNDLKDPSSPNVDNACKAVI